MRIRQAGAPQYHHRFLRTITEYVVSQNLKKVIPDTPKGEIPVHLRQKQVYATYPQQEPGTGRRLETLTSLDWTTIPRFSDLKKPADATQSE